MINKLYFWSYSKGKVEFIRLSNKKKTDSQLNSWKIRFKTINVK